MGTRDVNVKGGISCLLCNIHYCSCCQKQVLDGEKDRIECNDKIPDAEHWINNMFLSNENINC